MNTGSTYPITSSWAQSASYVPIGRSLVLCSAYTPPIAGADSAQLLAPFDIDGLTPVTWSVKRLNFRVESTGSISSSIAIERSTGSGYFNPTLVGTVTLSANLYETASVGSLGVLGSGEKLRFNINTLGTSLNWTVIVEIAK